MTDAPVPSVRRASALLASGTLLSRGLGFLNAILLATAIGAVGEGANAFAIANSLPNSIFLLISGGLLTAALSPQIVRAGLHPDRGQAYLNRLLTLALTLFAVVAIAATLAAPALVGLYTLPASSGSALSPAGAQLATVLAYWCLPQIFFYSAYSLISEVLNARGVFGPYAWAPVVNNVVLGATIVLFGWFFGVYPEHRDPTTWTGAEIALLAGGATLGIVLQAAFLLLFWRRTGLGFRPDFRWRGVGLGDAGRAAGWAFGLVVVNFVAGIVQTNVAVTAGSGDPSVSALRVAAAIFVLPHSIIATSIATPYFIRMSGHEARGDRPAVAADLSVALRTSMLLVTGAAAAIVGAALPLARLFASDLPEVGAIGLVFAVYLVGLPAFSSIFIVHRAYYSLGDNRTPFLIQLLQSGLFVAGALAVPLLPGQLVGVAISALLMAATAVQAIVLAVVLRPRLGGGGRRVLRRYAAYGLAAIPAAAAGAAVSWLLGGLDPAGLAGLLGDGGQRLAGSGFALSGVLPAVLSAAAAGVAALAVYLAVLAIARVPELASLAAILRRATRAR